jgi:ectoine hydroxylase-related dioxygenase (phytanoyl-CoA dioxygenase family)
VSEGTLREAYERDGFVVVRQIFDDEKVAGLREVCDEIFEQWVAESDDPEAARNYTNMAFLTEPRFLEGRARRRTTLLSAVADERVLRAVSAISGREPLFFNTQYFFEPADGARRGDWHRDQQFDAPDDETERERMRSTVGLHAHVALAPDDHLEYVPGTHARWDTPAELRIRRGLAGTPKNSDAMPGARRISLARGDAVFFSAWGIHRGRYVAGRVRRTFDIIYGTPPLWMTPPPTVFLRPGALEGLPPHARAFFTRFVETYRERWERGEHEESS